MSGISKNINVPHEKFITDIKTNKNEQGASLLNKEINIMDGGGRHRPVTPEKKDTFIGVDGGNPLGKREEIKKVQENITEIKGKLFPSEPLTLVKDILKETEPKNQLNKLMSFQKELSDLSSDELHEVKGYLESKKDEFSDAPKLKSLSFTKSDIVDSLLESVNKEIKSRHSNIISRPHIEAVED